MSNELYGRIKERLKNLDMTEREASLAAGGDADLIRNIKRGRSHSLRGPRLLALARKLETTPQWLLTGSDDHISSEDVAAGLSVDHSTDHSTSNGVSSHAPYRGELTGAIPEIDARAGAGQGQVGDSEVVTLHHGESVVGHRVVSEWVFPSTYLRHELRVAPGHLMMLEVVGDSMSPTLESGDRVLVDSHHARPSPDGIYVIDEGDGPMVKRLQMIRRSDPLQIRVISDNTHHEAYTMLLDDVRVIGRVAARLTKT